MIPKVGQMDLKIKEKSIPAVVLAEFRETLIFDDSIMVLLHFTVLGTSQIIQNLYKNRPCESKSKNRFKIVASSDFFSKNCEIYAKSDPQRYPKIH